MRVAPISHIQYYLESFKATDFAMFTYYSKDRTCTLNSDAQIFGCCEIDSTFYHVCKSEMTSTLERGTRKIIEELWVVELVSINWRPSWKSHCPFWYKLSVAHIDDIALELYNFSGLQNENIVENIASVDWNGAGLTYSGWGGPENSPEVNIS